MPTTEYLQERELLRAIFPRGRFVEDEDGTCIVRARRTARLLDHVFVQSPGKLLGVFYVGSGAVYRTRLGHLVRDWLKGDGEGIFHVAWVPAVADLLPWFSRAARKAPPGHMENLAKAQLANASRQALKVALPAESGQPEAAIDAQPIPEPSEGQKA